MVSQGYAGRDTLHVAGAALRVSALLTDAVCAVLATVLRSLVLLRSAFTRNANQARLLFLIGEGKESPACCSRYAELRRQE
jgi:hypothetical protein